MKLDSARELKQSLTATLLAPMAAAARVRSVPTFFASAPALANEKTATIALGVTRRGANDFALAVRVQSRALQESREVDLIRKQAKGEVDVRYVGTISKRAVPWHQQRQRPLRIGCSVAHHKVTAGTLGAFVRPRSLGTAGANSIAILSNNHVLASENRAKKGDAILQPGPLDGGQNPDDLVAKLSDFHRLKKIGSNFIDAAIATLEPGLEADFTKLTGLGKLKGVSDILVDEGVGVAKIGRTTGLTHGRVTAFEIDNVTIEFDLGVLRFDDQIEIEGAENGPFSDGGDSGSLIVGKDLLAVGLLFAGSDQGGVNGQGLTYAHPIRAVLETLKIDILLS